MEYKYYMMNKPAGCITARRDDRHKVVMEYIQGERADDLHPVGRLDKDTEGLLFLTNDGKWNQMLMAPDHHVKKKYYFIAMGTLEQGKIMQLEQGIYLKGETKKTAPAIVEVIGNTVLSGVTHLLEGKMIPKLNKNRNTQPIVIGNITITEGRKHQVKRMLKAAGCYIIYLKRIEIGGVSLDEGMAPGDYRELTEEEKNRLTIKEECDTILL